MEQNVPVLSKKIWSLVREVYFLLRKGIISKRKLLLDLNRMMKRGRIAGKALHNLMFNNHNHHDWPAFTTNFPSHYPSLAPGEYEFSCSNSPSTRNKPFSLFSSHKKHHSNNHQGEGLDMMAVNAAVFKAMEMIQSETTSPALPGFGRSPMVRQIRVTDSPFPLCSVHEDNHVDKAAEQFISSFYRGLRRENTKASFDSSY